MHYHYQHVLYYQSGTKPNLVAKILATKFGFVPDWNSVISVMQNENRKQVKMVEMNLGFLEICRPNTPAVQSSCNVITFINP